MIIVKVLLGLNDGEFFTLETIIKKLELETLDKRPAVKVKPEYEHESKAAPSPSVHETFDWGTIVEGKVINIFEPVLKGGGWLRVNVYVVMAELVLLVISMSAVKRETVIEGYIPVVKESIR